MSISGDCPKIKAFVQAHPFPERKVFLALLPTCPFQDVREGFLDFLPALLEMEDHEDFFYNSLRSIYESYVDHEDTNKAGQCIYDVVEKLWGSKEAASAILSCAFMAFRFYSPFAQCKDPEVKAAMESRISYAWDGIGRWMH